MFLPSFRHLIEIEALKTQNQNDLEKISLENKRISDIEALREKSRIHLNHLDEEKRLFKLTDKQLAIESLEVKIKRMQSQLEMVTNQKEQLALNSQLHTQENERSQLEETYFTQLERAEAIDQEKKDTAQFIEGSLKTLEDIKKEIAITSKKYQDTIQGRLQRILSLEELCQSALINFYHDVEKKFLPKRAVAYLVDKKCTQCHMQVDSLFKASIEEGRSFEVCPNCGRLLIPETAKIY